MTGQNSNRYSSQNRSVEWLNSLPFLQINDSKEIGENTDYRNIKLSSAFEENKKYNQILIKETFSETYIRISTTIDTLMSLYFYQIGSLYASHLLFYNQEYPEVNIALKSCFTTGLLSLYTSYYLTNSGLHNPAKMNLRYSFEALFIAKYISLNRGADLFDKWIDGEPANLSLPFSKKSRNQM